jgi:hypothetical protein
MKIHSEFLGFFMGTDRQTVHFSAIVVGGLQKHKKNAVCMHTNIVEFLL